MLFNLINIVKISMNSVMFLFLFCLLTSTLGAPNIVNVLEKFGYLKKKTVTGVSHSGKDIETAIREYQTFMKLTPSGILDTATYKLMQKPRCGFPDIIRDEDNPFAPSQPIKGEKAQAREINNIQIAEALTSPRYRWTSNKVTWKALGYSPQLPSSIQRQMIRSAFKKWSDISALQIQETSGDPDIVITFNRGQHGDGAANSFDGKGGVLAHAYFPGKSALSGDTHFDDDEQWSIKDEGTNLEIVAAHEFGHALGLPHSRDQDALMAPIYKYSDNYRLHNDDIRAIQRLYGSQTQGRVPDATTKKPVTEAPVVDPRSSICSLRFSAITEIQNGDLYVFRYKKVYKLKSDGGVEAGYPKHVRDVFDLAPINSNAAAYSPWTRKLYFFKGPKVWRFTGFRRDAGYPKTITDSKYPRSPSAAMVWRDGQIYLFKGKYFYVWDANTEKILPGYPRLLKDTWRRAPGNPESVMWSRDGFTYFFKNTRYFKFDGYTQRVMPGYPKDKGRAWLKCGGSDPR